VEVVEEITDRKGKERRDGGGNKTGEGGGRLIFY
jgi:hypothetical protein